MANKKTINVITAHVDPILGTTYKTEPMNVIPDNIAHAQQQYKQFKTQRTQKAHCQRTKKK